MKKLKTFIWKIRYIIAIRRLLRIPYRWCWENAGSALENINGDISECPIECANDERDEWVACADMDLL